MYNTDLEKRILDASAATSTDADLHSALIYSLAVENADFKSSAETSSKPLMLSFQNKQIKQKPIFLLTVLTYVFKKQTKQKQSLSFSQIIFLTTFILLERKKIPRRKMKESFVSKHGA